MGAMNNVEKIVVDWLTSLVGDSWPVSGDKPQRLPSQYILVDRTGGPRENMVLDKAEILIEVYHKTSRVIASDKANDIADHIVDLYAHDENITHATVNSVVNLSDIIGQYHRYQVYCDVWCRRVG